MFCPYPGVFEAPPSLSYLQQKVLALSLLFICPRPGKLGWSLLIWVGGRDQIRVFTIDPFIKETGRLREVRNPPEVTKFAWVRA